jgi:polysaccharide export outer membrane protein
MKKILLSVSLILVMHAIGTARQQQPAQKKPPAAQVKTQAQSTAEKVAEQAAQKDGLPKLPDGFVIGLEDVLSVIVWKVPEHSAPTVVVRPDGMITLPMIGEIRAAGFTPSQLDAMIAEKLQPKVENTVVNVSVLEIRSLRVSIVGQVAKQGAYPLGSPMTVLDLIARAGGLTEFAKAKDIRIIRKKDGKILKFNYKEVIRGEKLEQNVFLENGDTVLVPG